MREILFRGKRTDGKWIFGDLVYIFGNKQKPTIHYIHNEVDLATKNPTFDDVIPNTVGQYTGLCDKNGNRIFEGDFIYGFDYPITFEEGSFCATTAYQLTRFWLNSDYFELSSIEVIGNIHDNPELLNQ